MKQLLQAAAIFLLLSTLNSQLSTAHAQGTTFTYQGRLSGSGNPVSGNYDFLFHLCADPTGNTPLALSFTNSVPVTNGLFTTMIDFGPTFFNGSNYWLQVLVRTNGAGVYASLTPLQALTPTPYAIYASATSVAGLNGTISPTNLPNGLGGTGNSVNGITATVAGGTGNSVNANFGTVAGGANNTNNGFAATVGGGEHNIAGGGGDATVAGGEGNTASGIAATVGGGSGNKATGPGTVVSGGGYDGFSFSGNTASGSASVVGGGIGNLATNYTSTVGGGNNNIATGYDSTIGGGGGSTAPGSAATVSGGASNNARGDRSSVGGGAVNNANAESATVPGGFENTAGGAYSFAAGRRANANNDGAFVWADETDADFVSTANNQFLIRASGGVGIGTTAPQHQLDVKGNIFLGTAQSGAVFTEIGDTLYLGAPMKYLSSKLGAQVEGTTDWLNLMCHPLSHGIMFGTAGPSDSDPHSAPNPLMVIQPGGNVGIGLTAPAKKVEVAKSVAAVGAGASIDASVLLRLDNTGSDGNTSSPDFAGIGFGQNSTRQAIVGGTFGNDYLDFYTGGVLTAPKVRIDFNGKVGIGTSAPTQALHVIGNILASGTITGSSDRNVKTNFATISPAEVLAKVAGLPITRWNYDADLAVAHIGPMAQDFYAAFNVGMDDRHISMVDADGVALAAIQGLNEKLEVRSEKLEAENAELKARLEKLERLLVAKVGDK